jgi:hypothetical protein
MTAFRFVSQLSNTGFLDNREGLLQIVRTDELLSRWASANREAAQEIPVRWIVKQDQSQLQAAVREYASDHKAAISLRSKARRGRIDKVPPRCCLGLFAAADALGLGFVHGVPPHLYLEQLDLDVLRRLGLSKDLRQSRRLDFVNRSKRSLFGATQSGYLLNIVC